MKTASFFIFLGAILSFGILWSVDFSPNIVSKSPAIKSATTKSTFFSSFRNYQPTDTTSNAPSNSNTYPVTTQAPTTIRYTQRIPPPVYYSPPTYSSNTSNSSNSSSNSSQNNSNSNSSSNSSTNTNFSSNGKLFLVQQDFSSSMWNIAYSLGAQRSYLVGGDFGNTMTGTVDLNLLQKIIEGSAGYEAIPTSFTGYAVLDIEEPYFKWLREPASSDHFKYAQSEMLRALNFAKQLRPNAKWGYYDIPLFTIHFPGGSWADADAGARSAELATVFAPTDLINAVDFFAPSIYSAYPNSLTPSVMVNKELARNREAVQQSLPHANGRKIFTYISNRFWNSNPVYNYMAMPYQEFMDKQFIGVDSGASGVIFWGGDNYWYKLGYVFDTSTLPAYSLVSRNQIRAAWEKEIPSGIDPQTFINAFEEQTLRIIAKKLFGTSYAPKWPLF